MKTVIKVENISKLYSLQDVGVATIKSDLQRFWASVRGKEDPAILLAESNDRSQKGESDFVWALKDVSFEVKEGEVLGILGKNGAGKSTLLKILSRVASPTKGEIKVKGRLSSLLEVGTGFHPDLSGRENIFLNGAILGMTKAEIKRNFDEIVDFSGVERYIDTPVKRYSSGMYVRLAFAVAAHLQPEILIVDEVLAVGDTEFQAKCLGKMKDVSTQGRTVLFVSHSMPAIKNLCTRAILFQKGEVAHEGNVMDTIDKYLNTGPGISDEGVIPDTLSTLGSGDAKFRSIEVRNKSGEPVNTLYYQQPFSLSLQLEVKRDIENCILDFSIGGIESRYTYTSSFDINKNYTNLGKGLYDVKIDIDPKLLPGNYNFYLGVHDMYGGGTTLDLVERVKVITVLPITENESTKYPLDVTFGNVRVDGLWNINKKV